MNNQGHRLPKKELFDFRGKLFLKLHYAKISFYSFFSTLFNTTMWRLKKVEIAGSINFYGFSKAYRFPNSIISIGKNCTFRSDKYSNLIGINRNCIISTHSKFAMIKIGDNCGFSGVSIGCANSITIGNNVLVGANVIITDFDWHNIDPAKRRAEVKGSKPVIINDNVFIGVNAVIWKGVTIGKNSIIGANSLVTKDVPENVIYGGNPAKQIKELFDTGEVSL
jgi:acetyltransferase-like isoleucine patch superfamily enzyme